MSVCRENLYDTQTAMYNKSALEKMKTYVSNFWSNIMMHNPTGANFYRTSYTILTVR